MLANYGLPPRETLVFTAPVCVYTGKERLGGWGRQREGEISKGEATSISSWGKKTTTTTHILKFSSICTAENYDNKCSPSRAFLCIIIPFNDHTHLVK